VAKCKFCRKPGATLKPTGKMSHFCDFECFKNEGLKLVQKAEKIRVKNEKQDDAQKLSVLNQTVKYWRPKADTAFQLFSRLSKWGEPCYSCGATTGQMHGGHYVSKGAKKTLTRYAEDNCNPQCSTCNERLSGNIALYRPYLLQKIGSYRLSLLEGPMPLVHWKWDDYKRVHDWYNRLNKILKKEIDQAQF
jgi:hypothetical protein